MDPPNENPHPLTPLPLKTAATSEVQENPHCVYDYYNDTAKCSKCVRGCEGDNAFGQVSDDTSSNTNKKDQWSLSLEGSIRRCNDLNYKEVLHKCNSDPVKSCPLSPVCQKPWLQNQSQKKRNSPVSKCTLNLDGYSYVIVASPPDKQNEPKDTQVSNIGQNSKNGQLAKQGSLTILRRSSSKSLSGRSSRISYTDDEYLDSIDLEDTLPSVNSPEAIEKATLRLRVLLRKLGQGEISAAALQKNLKYAADVLESSFIDDPKDSERTNISMSNEINTNVRVVTEFSKNRLTLNFVMQ